MSVTTTVSLAGGVELPRVGLGTWQLSGRRAYDAIRHALDVGYRHIDTATMYGNEAEVGRAVRDSGLPRSEVFITTKLPAERARRARETLEASLRALDVEAVDLWLIHWPTGVRELVPTWEALLAARAEGLTRAVGVSNFSIDQIDRITAETDQVPALNQVPWSPFEHSAKTLAEHQQRGVVLEGYSPLKRSDLRSPVLGTIAKDHGVTPAQVVLRWHLQHDIVVIPKSATPERIDENLNVYGFELTDEEMSAIDGLS
jgi:diketogulonate reductase-like aldo/keto reductase